MTALRLLLAALVATLVLPLLAPASASAASYWVWSCRGPDGAPVATDTWLPYGTTASANRVDTCASGGALTVHLGTTNPDRVPSANTGFRYQLPTNVTPMRFRAEIAVASSSAMAPPGRYDVGLSIGSESVDLGIGTGGGCAVAAPTCSFGDLADPLTPANVVERAMPGSTALRFKAQCRSASACMPGPGDPPVIGRLFRTAIELEDAVAPTVGALSGSATAAGPLSGTRTVFAQVADTGGGIHRTALIVDGVERDAREGLGRCAQPFTTPVPCPDAERALFDLDTTALADGVHTVVVRATDAAGTSTDSAPLTVAVDNRPPAAIVVTPQTPPAPPASVAPQLTPPTAALAGARLVLPARRAATAGARVAGRLLDASGAPRAGVAVRFERRPFGGDSGDWKRLGTATTTGADGRFTLPRVREAGEVRALIGDADDPAATATVAFVAPARVSARASDRTLRNGDRFTLQAAVSGDGDAFAGREALIQARVSGRWRTVDSVRVAADGQVRWVYRFTSTRTTARYRFRVVLPQVRRLPWAQLRSPVVTVLVTP